MKLISFFSNFMFQKNLKHISFDFFSLLTNNKKLRMLTLHNNILMFYFFLGHSYLN